VTPAELDAILELPWKDRAPALCHEEAIAAAARLDDVAFARFKSQLQTKGSLTKDWALLVAAARRAIRTSGDDWARALRTSPESGAVLPTALNASLICERWEPLSGLVFNELTREPELRADGGPPVPLTDVELFRWQARIEQAWKVALPKNTLADALASAAAKRSYHPHRDRLDALEWDRHPRFAEYARDVLDCHDPLASRMISNTLVGCVARTYRPGSKVDTILTYQSEEQGFRKTTALEALFYDSFYAGHIDLKDKDTLLASLGVLVVILDEVDDMTTRHEWSAIKKWVSARCDRFRAPYARFSETHQRQFVFGATTNSTDFLCDPSGHRRWYVVKVGERGKNERIRRTIEIRDQLWAQARWVYMQNTEENTADPVDFTWWLTDDEEAMRRSGAAHFELEPSIVDDKVERYCAGREGNVFIEEIMLSFGVEPGRVVKESRLGRDIATALKKLHYHPDRIGRGAERRRCWSKGPAGQLVLKEDPG